jgi:hypothetical protein
MQMDGAASSFWEYTDFAIESVEPISSKTRYNQGRWYDQVKAEAELQINQLSYQRVWNFDSSDPHWGGIWEEELYPHQRSLARHKSWKELRWVIE